MLGGKAVLRVFDRTKASHLGMCIVLTAIGVTSGFGFCVTFFEPQSVSWVSGIMAFIFSAVLLYRIIPMPPAFPPKLKKRQIPECLGKEYGLHRKCLSCFLKENCKRVEDAIVKERGDE